MTQTNVIQFVKIFIIHNFRYSSNSWNLRTKISQEKSKNKTLSVWFPPSKHIWNELQPKRNRHSYLHVVSHLHRFHLELLNQTRSNLTNWISFNLKDPYLIWYYGRIPNIWSEMSCLETNWYRDVRLPKQKTSGWLMLFGIFAK